jgi:hypothetical protein
MNFEFLVFSLERMVFQLKTQNLLAARNSRAGRENQNHPPEVFPAAVQRKQELVETVS